MVGISAMGLSNNHLVYLTGQYVIPAGYHVGRDVFIYHRQDTHQPFNLRQHFNSSDFDDNIVHALALDEDILVIAGHNKTHVFSEQNGVFEKSLSLNQVYESVQISQRSLIATADEEVHAFAIDDCTQAIPTQRPSSPPSTYPSQSPSSTPSISYKPSSSANPSVRPSSSSTPTTTAPTNATLVPTFAPTLAPTFSPTLSQTEPPAYSPTAHPSESYTPSMSPSPSALPSASFSPTETCYWIDVSIVFDRWATRTSWNVRRINDVGDNIVVKTYDGIWDDIFMLRKESMCLKEGQYQFSIYVSLGGGLGGDGHYNVTSYGQLIVEGAEFRGSETTIFSLPFSPAPSTMPSISYKPSSSANPSVRPSSSSTPTRTTAPTYRSLVPTFSPTDSPEKVEEAG